MIKSSIVHGLIDRQSAHAEVGKSLVTLASSIRQGLQEVTHYRNIFKPKTCPLKAALAAQPFENWKSRFTK